MDEYELNKMTPKVREKYLETMRDMPPGKIMKLALDLNEFRRDLIRTRIRAQNPGIGEEDLRKELICSILPADIVKKVYGWEGHATIEKDDEEMRRMLHEHLLQKLGL